MAEPDLSQLHHPGWLMAFRTRLQLAVQPRIAAMFLWSTATAPRLENTCCLKNIFMPTLQSSIFDSCNEEALQGATTSIPLTASESVSTQSAFFNQRLAPLAHAAASRIKLKKGWEVVIAWAVAYNAT
jgi:hypothetical protein